jgi:hypothetical protein
MKQKIYLLGLITIAIIVIGALFKISHWPGAGQLIILGIVLLVFFFLPLALRNHYMTAGNKENKMLYIVTWLTCLVVFGGMLYKTMHWPGAGKILMVALPFPYVVFLPVFLAVTSKDKNFSIHNTVSVLFLLTGISVFSALLALNVSKERIDDSMQLSRSYNSLEALLDEIPPPADSDPLVQKIDELLGLVDEYQSLILVSRNISEDSWNNDPWSLRRPEAADIGTPALVTGGKNPSPDLRLQRSLESLLNDLGNSPGYENLATAAYPIFDFMESADDPDDWTMGKFFASPGVWSLTYLEGLETKLKLLKAGMH